MAAHDGADYDDESAISMGSAATQDTAVDPERHAEQIHIVTGLEAVEARPPRTRSKVVSGWKDGQPSQQPGRQPTRRIGEAGGTRRSCATTSSGATS